MRSSARNRDANIEKSVVFLARWGLHGKTIAREVGITVDEVYRICWRQDVKLRTYRDGGNSNARDVIKVNPYTVVQRSRGAA